jgi:hypothetical protein
VQPALKSAAGDMGAKSLPNGGNGGDDPEWLAVLAERSELRRPTTLTGKRRRKS